MSALLGGDGDGGAMDWKVGIVTRADSAVHMGENRLVPYANPIEIWEGDLGNETKLCVREAVGVEYIYIPAGMGSCWLTIGWSAGGWVLGAG